MESGSEGLSHNKKFETPRQEVEFLHNQTQEKVASPESLERPEKYAEEVVRAYEQENPEQVLSSDYMMRVDEIEETILHLSPEHDKTIDELALLIEEKGVKNALEVVRKMDNPHIADDFHRFLVQYLAETGHIQGLKEGSDLFKALDMVLYEVTLPRVTSDGQTRSFSEVVSGMEQFYAGMLAIDGPDGGKRGKRHFTFEIALSNFSEEVIFYCAIPSRKTGIFEKQLSGVFPGAVARVHQEDYNPFYENGVASGSVAKLVRLPIFPLKVHTDFENDPLNIILHAFGKMKREGEGAAIQLVFSPSGDTHNRTYEEVIKKMREGYSAKDAHKEVTAGLGKEFFDTTKEVLFGIKPKKASSDAIDEAALKAAAEKITSPIAEVNIRIVASAENEQRVEAIVSELEAVFNQFSDADSNSITFNRYTGKALDRLVNEFSFRTFSKDELMLLNISELTTLFHFPVSETSASTLKQTRAKTAAPPLSLAEDGVLLGKNTHDGTTTDVHLGSEDRMRHFYVLGQTGTGKTTLLKNMIVQDIQNGEGVCMIDPHGSDVQDILAHIPESRIDDVIYFDPADTEQPMGLNMLEYDRNQPQQKTFVVNELFSIFQKLYGGSPESMGPMFEQYFRNATMLVIEDPESGSTLLEVSRVMSDAKFREMKLQRCKNPVVVQFWREVAGKADGEAALANIVPYITSKFDVFLSNDVMRPIIAQEHSAFNFREIMDERKILLVNLSKGRLGDINSNLIGLILVGKILMAALSRVDATERPDFYLYIDEFQNVTTDSIATILSEARKYRLGLNIAHQFIAQLDDKTKDAVFGNVGSIGAFRTGAEDAGFLESQFAPTFSADDIMHLENRNAYLKLLVDGYPERPFNIETIAPGEGTPGAIEKLKELSAMKYGRPREEIEQEIMKRYS